jgi:glucose/arabinose dehydrogenase
MARPSRFQSTLAIAFLLCLAAGHGWSQQSGPQQKPQSAPQQKPINPPQKQQNNAQQKPQNNQQQMRGLDEQIQEVKSDTLRIAAELNQLEEKLLYPSGTQVAVFVATGKGDTMRLDAVRLQIDGQLVAHYIYSFKELEALHKGGVQRLYVGNVATGDHQLEVLVEGKLENGTDFSRNEKFAFRKDVKPKLVGLTLTGSDAKSPITLGEW